MIYFLQSAICMLLFYTAFHFLYKDKHHHGFNRFYLLSSLFLSILVPLIQIPVYPEYVKVIQQQIQQPVAIATSDGASHFTWEWIHTIIAIYALGVLLMLSLFTRRLLTLKRIIGQGERKRKSGYTEVMIRGDELPISSFFHYLLVPQGKNITKEEEEHERIHIRQKHSWDILFLEIVQIIFWFNPIVLLYRKRMVEIHEYLADSGTISIIGQDAYEAYLVQQVSINTKSPLVHNFYSLFEKRIKMMNSDFNSKPWQFAVAIPIVFLTLVAFSFKDYKVYQLVGDDNGIPNLEQDTFPPMPPELEGQIVDTVIIFDPVTMEETIEYVIFTDENLSGTLEEVPPTPPGGVDTLVTFNPDDFSETIMTIDPVTGEVIDTLHSVD